MFNMDRRGPDGNPAPERAGEVTAPATIPASCCAYTRRDTVPAYCRWGVSFLLVRREVGSGAFNEAPACIPAMKSGFPLKVPLLADCRVAEKRVRRRWDVV